MTAVEPTCGPSFETLCQTCTNKNSWYKYREGKKAGLSNQQLHQLIFRERTYHFSSGSHIDPRDFFGRLIEEYPEGIPEDYATMIAQEINGQEIHTYGRVECQIPTDWHRSLVEKLLAKGICVDDGARTTLEHPKLSGYNRNEDGTLINRRSSGNSHQMKCVVC